MAISTRGRYGVRALLAIAAANRPLSTTKIAKLEDISLSYLEQIFNRLKRAGLIHAKRGAQGGFSLSRPPQQITVGDVIRILDGPVRFAHCHKAERETECDRAAYCVSRRFWTDLEDTVNMKLSNTTLQDLKNIESGLVKRNRGKHSATNLL
jgi:Rrf2 family protein